MLSQFDFEKQKTLCYEAANANEQAFNELYRYYVKIVKDFVSKMLKAYNLPKYLEDDITQETFIIFSRDIRKIKLDAKAGLRPWLFTVANNQIRNQLKKQKFFLSLDTEEAETKKLKERILNYMPKLDENINEEELREIINKEVEKLNSPFKEVFKVYLKFDLTVDELSKHFHIREGTVKSRLSRGRVLLIPILDPLRKYFQ